MAYNTVQKGSQYNESYRVFLEKQGTIVSPWHDIPLFADKTENIFNIVVEIPRWTNAKMEMDTKSRMNPIKQDIKKGKLRFVANVFPHHGYIWNYGAFPQTWEDPSHVDENTHAKGDNDPLDVCEIGQKIHKRGDVVQVKVLGVLAMIDEGETDWKVIAIDVTDPLAHDLHDIDDVEKHMPGLLKATVEWFTLYKVPDGKPKNSFAFNNEAKPKSFALKVISDLHHQWEALVHNKCSHADLVGDSVTLSDSPYKVSADESKAAADSAAEHGPDHSVPAEVSHVVYMKH